MWSKWTQKVKNSNEFSPRKVRKSMLTIITGTACVCHSFMVLTVVLSLDWWATLRGWWLSTPVKKESCCNDGCQPARGNICECDFSHTTHIHIHKCTLNSPNVSHRYWEQIVFAAFVFSQQTHPDDGDQWNTLCTCEASHHNILVTLTL